MTSHLIHPDRPGEYYHAGFFKGDNRGEPALSLCIDLRHLAGEALSQRDYAVESIVFDEDNELDMTIYNGLKEKFLAKIAEVQARDAAAKAEREARA